MYIVYDHQELNLWLQLVNEEERESRQKLHGEMNDGTQKIFESEIPSPIFE